MFALYVQVYQVEYVIVKAANSPRPAAWILEKSLDGKMYQPWQYYAPSDDECWTRYSVPPVIGKPVYVNDNDVICTSQYSRQTPMENGEVSARALKLEKRARPTSASLSFFSLLSAIFIGPHRRFF
jgi:laminin alpha 1/2